MTIKVDITKTFKSQKNFLLQASFSNSDGTLGILGASGSGKSMTLKCIAGIVQPDEGSILLDDKVLFDSKAKINLKPQLRNIGYLFQNYKLFPKLTVFQNITIALHEQKKYSNARIKIRTAESGMQNIPRAEDIFVLPETCTPARIKELAKLWIERFELQGMENRYPNELSGGQQQRCALARMLVLSPRVLLLDEPFSALDSGLREQMQLRLQTTLSETSAAAIMVSHNRDEVYRLCKNLAVMEDGKIISLGNTKEIFNNPKNLVTARMTGCKNISPVRKIGGNTYFALDWGLELHTENAVGRNVKYIGIRAHDIVNGDSKNMIGMNEIEINVVQQSNDPFENTVIFTNNQAKSPAEKKQIWWKYSKYLEVPIIDKHRKVFFPPQSLLLIE
ncbi:MAG: sulfate/molybdate ABC transporter ATP-binding protein [Termitinemataceae bacterium]|nr:MAG: sulfate/molybdate ABC transporter ATP-binding protein [Termitinemataceae bacterium]